MIDPLSFVLGFVTCAAALCLLAVSLVCANVRRGGSEYLPPKGRSVMADGGFRGRTEQPGRKIVPPTVGPKGGTGTPPRR